jgi:MutS domain V
MLEKLFDNDEKISHEDLEDSIHQQFKLPITYTKHERIPESMNLDLELSKSIEDNKTFYEHVVGSDTDTSKLLLHEWAKYYTNDETYLTNTQILLKKLKIGIRDVDVNMDILNDIYTNEEFDKKYDYISIKYFTSLNQNVIFLLLTSIYSLLSPLTFVLTPIYLLLIPFLAMNKLYYHPKFKDVTNYFQGLLIVIVGLSVFQMFYADKISDKMLHFMYVLFFILRIYLTVRGTYIFYNNLTQIQEDLFELKKYVTDYLENIEHVNQTIIENQLSCYYAFNSTVQTNKSELIKLKARLDKIDFPVKLYYHYKDLGNLRSIYYDLKHNMELKTQFTYSFGMNSYLMNLYKIQEKIKQKQLNLCVFKDHTSFKDAYYGMIEDPVKNSYSLKHNYIITGPNASGKTTFIKTTMLNVILSQQIGYGYYRKATISLYDQLCCYLNIPDTSNRDSLFQLEARRCKEILETIHNKKTLCIFDELFSGTNPFEATASSYAFLKYINTKCTFLLTTHFVDVCDKFNDINIKNYHMKMIDNQYTYELSDGKSDIKGGIQVLKAMDYPDTIIEDATNYMNKL